MLPTFKDGFNPGKTLQFRVFPGVGNVLKYPFPFHVGYFGAGPITSPGVLFASLREPHIPQNSRRHFILYIAQHF
jgi:hypothetical protein